MNDIDAAARLCVTEVLLRCDRCPVPGITGPPGSLVVRLAIRRMT
jgi:hypothetical protein